MEGPAKPLILQSDHSVLLEVDNPAFEAARDMLARFAELESSPEHIHTYRITPLSLWNAAASGMLPDEILGGLEHFSKYPIPPAVRFDIANVLARYGRLRLEKGPLETDPLQLVADDPHLLTEVLSLKQVIPHVSGRLDPVTALVPREGRGFLKQALLKAGFPVEDEAGHTKGAPLEVSLLPATRSGSPLSLRPYQVRAADAFWAGGGPAGGSGVVVLPCGAGKTLVGMAAMSRVQAKTLILCTGTTAVRQWITELLDKTTLAEDDIGEYTGEKKEIRPVTVATYPILVHGKGKSFPHFHIFGAEDWGLIIYDEVHLLPAPVFRMTAAIQSRRRLGLTATLVREDGLEGDVFSLIGPKKYDAPWKELESLGWIASVTCTELRLPLPASGREAYAAGETHEQFRIAATNPAKTGAAREIVRNHREKGDRILVIGRFLDQVEELARDLGAPFVTGATPSRAREELYRRFRDGDLDLLVVSNVANFSLDLPDASVAIEVSGTFGSRQEEAQRLGRILRPKSDGRQAAFYTLVSEDTVEEGFATRRRRFLTEQGYRYEIRRAEADTSAAFPVISLAERREGRDRGSRPSDGQR